MEKYVDARGHLIARKIVTPISASSGLGSKTSSVSYSIGPEISFLQLKGCAHAVTFKFDMNDPSTHEKLQNIMDSMMNFATDLSRLLNAEKPPYPQG